jgi:hypothetical protein
VLQVGNGQITRSMYRQLDEAAPGQFQPFGRVKDNERTPKELWVVKPREEALQLVGRDTKTGALVRCDAYPVRQLDRPRQLETRQQRCKVDLDELQRQWREKADNQLAEILKAQTKYDKFKALPLIVLPD